MEPVFFGDRFLDGHLHSSLCATAHGRVVRALAIADGRTRALPGASGSRATAAYVVFAVNNDDLSPTVYENLLGDDQVARRGSFGSGRFEDRSSGRAKVEFSWTR